MKDTIGIDLAKNVYQLHGATMTGQVKFRRKSLRGQFLRFMENQPPAVIVMEACGSAHHWARELVNLGHEVTATRPNARVSNFAHDACCITLSFNTR